MISEQEAARKIKEIYNQEPDFTNKNFNIYEQLRACESIAEDEEEERRRQDYKRFQEPYKEDNESVNGNGNDTCKRRVNFELTQSRQNAILQLKACNYRTPPLEISSLLEIIFEGSNTQPGWWLAVAQQWNPRAVYRVLNQMIKAHSSGWATIKKPGAYFTFLIKKRKKRRNVGINDTRK